MLPPFVWHQPHRLLLSLIVLAGLLAGPVVAQSPFSDCTTRTETNATLLLPDTLTIVLDGDAASAPVHLGVFTPLGECVGAVRWRGAATSLTIWGRNPTRPDHVGPSQAALVPGDTLQLRLYDPATKTEYAPSRGRMTVSFQSSEPYHRTTPRYVPNGIYVLDEIRARRTLASREE
jgi:hypothetical protein